MIHKKLIIVVLFLISIIGVSAVIDWGFYGHRKINRMAVFTLPQEMIGFYKSNIEYVTAHAVDPDKRRYATKFEAFRHYIDLDHWGTYPFDELPRQHYHAILKYADIYAFSESGDSSLVSLPCYDGDDLKSEECSLMFDLFYSNIKSRMYDDEIACDCEPFRPYMVDKEFSCSKVVLIDNLTGYGVLPYFFPNFYDKLVKAFERNDTKDILRYSADIGHYIGDAHVPLHTTENYNGQLTDQVGIHGFWESRVPELFAEEEFNFLVGSAEKIPNIKKWIWNVVLKSHSYLPEVLENEKLLSQTYPEDQQFCFEDRLERTVFIQCEAYSKAYKESMDGMVETRMQDAVLAIGSVWYSAWIDAGQPDLDNLVKRELSAEDIKAQEELDEQFNSGSIKGREHGR